ncbi:unnamed protein product [Tilletia controversa]|uniref:Alpha/beta hydrolase fold-3 domain-containing protein n=3 Tax=Tilletia TaxID=13289 RepID=A0A8X7MPL6_9BASI|nr:hypothetical protein CF336_g6312 [Tilletia laevis]KAE8191024.1 hypothetical protein CF328_g5806 [Tilletia controversa]KAE8254259.1 hypothetical protein A4X03_0g5746 [Tilletia caries]KAE8193503.1 hypothetical protein CF335_g5572 [Tilletia laevis]KAE8243263.1 hypothetical protein A4X06_0g6441 [Tilletia controversa]
MQAIRYAKAKAAMALVRTFVSSLMPAPKWMDKDPPSRVVQIEATQVKKYKITLNIYEPAAGAAPGGPVVLNWHGSSFVFNSFWGSSASFSRRLAEDLGIVVIDCSYPQAPEHPYPQALHCAIDVINYVVSDAAFGNPQVLAVTGFSSGGNIALNMASSELGPSLGLAPEHQAKIKGCAVSCAPTAFQVDTKSKDPNDDGLPKDIPGLPLGFPALELFTDCYLYPTTARTVPSVSPSLANPTSFSNAKIALITASHDPLRFEGLAMHEALAAAGVDSVHYRAEGVGHAFELQGGDDRVAWSNDNDNASPLAKARREGYATMSRCIAGSIGKTSKA